MQKVDFSTLFKHLAASTFFLGILFLSSCGSTDDPIPDGPLPALELFDSSYGQDARQVMDIFLPAGRTLENTPVMIYIHGGAWIDGSKDEFLQFKTAFEQALPDFAFVAINYRLFDFITNANRFPTQENDVIAAIQHVLENRVNWNISDELYLAGASAGGHLALLHAYKHQEVGNIQAVLALFPPTDLTTLYDFNFLTQSGLTALLNGNPQSNPDAYFQSSPVNFINPNSPPTAFFHGTVDTVVPISQSDLLASKLEEAGVPYEYQIIEGQGHGFTPATYATIISQISAFIDTLN
ncbi:alpha/beta hydrolase [Algoriphagus kandeliae]|uniref:Alpha/beta hydrolase n=1 Tax=Algoriphagus kandeliae TaxID=2562278 RepID=A0A4Y9QTW8_9BACT|nr:alpha/beta hydrolase [Algoriphagus kandeliae]TFV95490.1 alpha/beta hydrolase [Algoriphagus kandeliae]